LDNAYHKRVTSNLHGGTGPGEQERALTTDGAAPKRKTGFALLDEEARKRIATSGGRASAKSDKAWRWTRQEALEMAPLGGHAARDKRRAAAQRD